MGAQLLYICLVSPSHRVHVATLSPGVSVQLGASVYTASEDNRTVELVLLKKGLSSFGLTVTLTTEDSSATGTQQK